MCYQERRKVLRVLGDVKGKMNRIVMGKVSNLDFVKARETTADDNAASLTGKSRFVHARQDIAEIQIT